MILTATSFSKRVRGQVHEPSEEALFKTYYSDEEIWHVITNLCGMTTAAEKGIGPRALSRLTGVAYSIVQRATSAENEKRLRSGIVCESTLEDEDWYSYC